MKWGLVLNRFKFWLIDSFYIVLQCSLPKSIQNITWKKQTSTENEDCINLKISRTVQGAITQVLRTSTLALLYSVTDYSLVWERSRYPLQINRHQTAKMCSHNYWESQVYKITVVTGFGQHRTPKIRLQNSVLQFTGKVHNNPALPIHEDGIVMPRLKSDHLSLRDYNK